MRMIPRSPTNRSRAKLRRVRKIAEIARGPARLKLIRSDGRRRGQLGVYIGAISPSLAFLSSSSTVFSSLPPHSLSLSFSLLLCLSLALLAPQSVSARVDWQGFAISVTRPVTNFDLHNWRNTLRDYRFFAAFLLSFIILYFPSVRSLASCHSRRYPCVGLDALLKYTLSATRLSEF